VTNLLEHVEQSIRKHSLFRDGERIVVAVSGGGDSTMLLHVLQELAGAHRWRLAVAHLNHQLRGRSSEADERFVRQLATRLDLPALIERADVRSFAKANKLSLEIAARQLRHEFLARTAARFKARVVALAHQADDQVELFFLRLFRGAGGEGLGGMKWRSPSPVRVWSSASKRPGRASADRLRAELQTELARPVLDVPREALRRFAAERKLAFREDNSNTSLDILRNRIRRRLLPLLRSEFQPAIGQTVARLMDIVGAESAFVREAAEGWLRRKRRPAFEKLPSAAQRAALRLQLLERGVLPDFQLVERLRAEVGRAVTFSPGHAVLRDEMGLVHVRATRPAAFKPGRATVKLEGRGGEIEFGRLRISWRVLRTQGIRRPPAKPRLEFLDADTVGSPIVLRHWRPGDRFQPIGMVAAVKLQDLLTNARVPPVRRRELVVATTREGRIFWVEDLRIGALAKLSAGTIHRLHWGWKRL
jgi:tRNA(Ile)-lysidine synthase